VHHGRKYSAVLSWPDFIGHFADIRGISKGERFTSFAALLAWARKVLPRDNESGKYRHRKTGQCRSVEVIYLYAKASSAAILGIDGVIVTVEVDVSGGLPGFEIVGLVDTSVREARQ